MTYVYMKEGDYELLRNRLEEFGSVYFKYYGQEPMKGKKYEMWLSLISQIYWNLKILDSVWLRIV